MCRLCTGALAIHYCSTPDSPAAGRCNTALRLLEPLTGWPKCLLLQLIVSRVREAALFQTGRPLAATPFAANQTATGTSTYTDLLHADQLTETGGHALVAVFLIGPGVAVHYPEVLQSCY